MSSAAKSRRRTWRPPLSLSEAQKQAILLQTLGAGRQAPEEQTPRNAPQTIAELKAQNRTLRDLLAQQKRSGSARAATIG